MSRIRRIAPGLGRGGLIGNTEGPESYLRELDTLPSQFCRATGGTETVIEESQPLASLLLNFDGSNGSTTFTDDSIYGHTVTANGDAQISTTQSKFGGSSGAFDGTGDYLTVPNDPTIQLTNSEAWTIECWFYASALSTQQHFLHRYDVSSPFSGYGLAFGSGGAAATTLRFWDGGSWRDIQTSVSTGQWYHVAVSFEGTASTARLFLDGVQKGAAFTPSASISNTSVNLGIGAQYDGSLPFNGYIDSLRITKGAALYAATFTPSTKALERGGATGKYYRVHTFTDTDPTSLLLNFDGSNGSTTFTDDSGWGHAVTANGDAQISTTESRFGGSSAAFDGSGDSLTVQADNSLQFGTEDFTFETWVYFASVNASFNSLCTVYTSGGFTPYVVGPSGYFGNANSLVISNRVSNLLVASWTPNTSQWYHVAISRNGSSLRVFIDGSLLASATNSTNFSQGALYIGGSPVETSLNGYIDSLRITKGQALYNSAFTPSTTALARVGSGSLTFTRGGAVEYLVVGGGGGGWYSGAGAGGLRAGRITAGLSAQVSVGGGGSGGAVGSNGASSFLYSIASAGGAGGKTSTGDGKSGGCGGGAASGANQPAYSGGSGNTPSVSPPQGFDGGDSAASGANTLSTGGGGGAGGAGQTGGTGGGGNGGQGQSSSISGTSTAYSGGGGGAGTVSGGVGGVGGGGDSGNTGGTTPGEPGEQNTGGGGGGGGSGGYAAAAGGSGGSGIVIARYRITQAEYEAEAA